MEAPRKQGRFDLSPTNEVLVGKFQNQKCPHDKKFAVIFGLVGKGIFSTIENSANFIKAILDQSPIARSILVIEECRIVNVGTELIKHIILIFNPKKIREFNVPLFFTEISKILETYKEAVELLKMKTDDQKIFLVNVKDPIVLKVDTTEHTVERLENFRYVLSIKKIKGQDNVLMSFIDSEAAKEAIEIIQAENKKLSIIKSHILSNPSLFCVYVTPNKDKSDIITGLKKILISKSGGKTYYGKEEDVVGILITKFNDSNRNKSKPLLIVKGKLAHFFRNKYDEELKKLKEEKEELIFSSAKSALDFYFINLANERLKAEQEH